MTKVICTNCGTEFNQSNTWAGRNKHHFCNRTCYYEWREDIKNHPRWKMGKVEMQGYIFIRTPGHPYGNKYNYVKRSRLVMEKFLGRYLEPDETIHHINFNREDDRFENLLLFETKGEHQKYHWEIRKQIKMQEQLELALT